MRLGDRERREGAGGEKKRRAEEGGGGERVRSRVEGEGCGSDCVGGRNG